MKRTKSPSAVRPTRTDATPPYASSSASADAGTRKLRYDVIRNRLRQALQERRIVPGLVLLEGPVAEVFGTSRVPVRTAFDLLFEEGLLQKFPGRGYLAAPRGSNVAPQRLPINEASLGQDGRDATIHIPPESERIYGQLEEAISTCVVFGHFRIDEVRAIAHYKVNRAAVREALGRLVDRGLVEKSVYASWRAGPLTARAIAQDFELRLLLEPEALRSSGPLLDPQLLSALHRRLLDPAALDTESLLSIERQIHGDCLAHHPNTKMLGLLRQCGMPLIVNQLFCRMFNQPPHPALVAEYLLVVDHLCAQRFAQGADALAAHLQAARKRTQQQLKALAVLPEPPLPDYLVRIA